MQKRVNEDVIDFDLLEDLVCYIDENYPPGAILVFLPVSASSLVRINRASSLICIDNIKYKVHILSCKVLKNYIG